MRNVIVGLVSTAISLSPVLASAATISPQGGQILVNTGAGYHIISSAIQARPGARVLIRNGGTALISYGNACSVRIGSGRVWHVANKAPCSPGTNFIDLAKLKSNVGATENGEPSGNAQGNNSGWETTTTPAQTPPPAVAGASAAGGALSTTAVVIGGLAIAGGVGLALAATGGGSSDDAPAPASP